jgi:CheY-like chemotaxis protein
VARILVADDNSNIQKMVGLALKDHGIEVVAVGNGEAAVRKISDVKPDLVLADVFMPVRNGYEVCKYVKDDASLAHIPVILLVGAFDPLDEQEAQRVGADGVLKKPFVPPDPLISMVKSALMRASTAQAAAAAAEKAPVATTVSAPSVVATAGGAPTVFAIPQEAKEEAALVGSFVDESPSKPGALQIESAGKPLAFGSLMDTSTEEPVDDAAFVAPPSPELVDRDWNSAEDDNDEEEEEDSASASWRRDAGGADFAPEPEKAAAPEKESSRGKKREGWTPTREKTQDLLEEVAAPELVSAPVASVEAHAAAPQNLWAASKPEPELAKSNGSEAAAIPAPAEFAPAVNTVIPETVGMESAKPSTGNSWFSTTSSPWEAEAQKATQLASTWDAPAIPPTPVAAVESGQAIEQAAFEVPAETPVEAPVSYDFVSEAPSEEPVQYVPDPGLVQNEVVEHNPLPGLISDGSISPETVENIRQETSYALDSVVPNVEVKPTATPVAEKIGETSQHDMDLLVANVLAKMSPEMLQAVTREILKPVVAAMIRDEITKKS